MADGKIQDPEIREKVAYFLMDKLRLGGAEYAHITRKNVHSPQSIDPRKNEKQNGFHHGLSTMDYGQPLDFTLIGADSLKLHRENIKQYQESAKHQKETEDDLKVMDDEIRNLAQHYFPKPLKEWMVLKEKLDRNELDVVEYWKRFIGIGHRAEGQGEDKPYALTPMPNAAKEFFQQLHQLETDFAASQLKEPRDRQIFRYYKSLQLLKRLNRLEVTEEEFEAVKKGTGNFPAWAGKLPVPFFTQDIAAFIADHAHKSIVLSKQWEENIRSAMRFYEVAKLRDEAVEKALKSYKVEGRRRKVEGEGKTNQNQVFLRPSTLHLPPAVLVYGGFHKQAIKSILRRNRLSYYSVTPRITTPSPKHQSYYKQLMRMGYDNIALPNLVTKATKAPDIFDFPEPLLTRIVQDVIASAEGIDFENREEAIHEMDRRYRDIVRKAKTPNKGGKAGDSYLENERNDSSPLEKLSSKSKLRSALSPNRPDTELSEGKSKHAISRSWSSKPKILFLGP